ncbi:ATP-dependent helicase [Streptomyces sviceus]|uniref:ATP-dependent helicase n=1 Tax=Streptomyces sviceus TaxID=285530 RepID=UPI00332EAB32
MTDNQQALVDAEDSLFAVACPGAGKTHAMVTRFLKRTSEETRKGVALISFTNAAVDEVRSRCGNQTTALEVPHFVGTFDTFIHRFIVTPIYTREYKQRPNYVQSWREITSTNFRLVPHLGRAGNLEFDWFDFDPLGRATLDLRRVPQNFGNAAVFEELVRRKHVAEAQASHIFGRLLRSGTVSCQAARLLAEHWLASDKERSILTPLIRSRFAEVIVDEVQDCGQEELRVLEFLRDCGVRIILVGDIDQSIYEFRSATPDAVQKFAATLPSPPLELKDNWRSSPAICAFNGALRSGQLVETARGENSIIQTPVYVVEFSDLKQVVPAALETAEQYKLAADDLMILSHAEVHSMKAAGAISDGSGNNKVLGIANAGLKLQSREADPKTRRKAITRVERDILALLTAGQTVGHHSFDAMREQVGIEQRWLDDFTVRLVMGMSTEGKSRQAFAAEVRDFLKNADWGDVQPPDASDLSNLYKAPTNDEWSNIESSDKGPAVRFSTVHGVKGKEFPGVVLVLPDRLRADQVTERTVLDDWEGGHNSEARRVLYVAGSRAQKLLIFAVHRKHVNRVVKMLEDKGVPHIKS